MRKRKQKAGCLPHTVGVRLKEVMQAEPLHEPGLNIVNWEMLLIIKLTWKEVIRRKTTKKPTFRRWGTHSRFFGVAGSQGILQGWQATAVSAGNARPPHAGTATTGMLLLCFV